MTRKVEAIFENGVFRPLEPLPELVEHTRVQISVEMSRDAGDGLSGCIGILPDADAAEMLETIQAEFEQVDEREWQ